VLTHNILNNLQIYHKTFSDASFRHQQRSANWASFVNAAY
jgi:hypothetical protein